jgi:hypothetical protein
VVVVGDVHGHYENTITILRQMDILNSNDAWIAPIGTTLVQLGDVMDIGSDGVGLLRLFRRLRQEARSRGGEARAQAIRGSFQVINLIGNHDYQNLRIRSHPHVNADELARYFDGNVDDRWEAFQRGGELHAELSLWPIARIIRGNLFSHAGYAFPHVFNHRLTCRFLERAARLGVDFFNNGFREAIQNPDTTPFEQNYLLKSAPLVKSPIWHRLFKTLDPANLNAHTICDSVKDALRHLNVFRMFVGHVTTPTGEIMEACDGQLILMDTGISDGNLSAATLTFPDGLSSHVGLLDTFSSQDFSFLT